MNGYDGRRKCEKLREMRKAFAKANGISYDFPECTHEGPCAGTCSFCEREAAVLERLAGKKQMEEFSQTIYPQIEINPEETVRYVPRNQPSQKPPMVQGMMRPSNVDVVPVRTMGLVVSPKGDMEPIEKPEDELPLKEAPEIKMPGFLRKKRRKS